MSKTIDKTKYSIRIDEQWADLGFQSRDALLKELMRRDEKSLKRDPRNYAYEVEIDHSKPGRPKKIVYIDESTYDKLQKRTPALKEKFNFLADLQEIYFGKMYVKCFYGTIDLLTDREIFVVEEGVNWLRGIGRLLAFAKDKDDKPRQLRLVLYNCSKIDRARAERLTEAISIVQLSVVDDVKEFLAAERQHQR